MIMYPNYEDGHNSHLWADGDSTGDGLVNFDDIMALYPFYDSEADSGAYVGSATADETPALSP